MANIVLTFKVMPDSPETNLKQIEESCGKLAKEFGTEIGKVEIEPIAFGLKALKLFLVLDESKGSPDKLEEQFRTVRGVQSVEVTDVRRTIG